MRNRILCFCVWLAGVSAQAQDAPQTADSERKPVTCTDAAGVLYERGTPGFERCLREMEQAAREEPTRDRTREERQKKKSE